MMTTDLTEAQKRVLLHLAKYPRWHSLVDLDQIRLLDPDDVLVVPSLIERGLVMHFPRHKAVAISESGQVIADEIISKGLKDG